MVGVMARSSTSGGSVARRLALAAAFAAVSVAVMLPAGLRAASPGIAFASLPTQVFEGQRVTLIVLTKATSKQCTLTVRYTGKRVDRRTVPASFGKASWTLRIPAVPPGVATVSATCTGTATVTGKMLVQWALEAPKITVTRSGYTQRMLPIGSEVSFGLTLQNDRSRSDATNVAVLVNFVDSTNRVLGTAHLVVGRLPASSTFSLGGQQPLSTKTIVSRLEIVLEATSAAKQISTPPLVSDLLITPSTFEPYVGSVSGQILNHYAAPMQSGAIGVIVLDAAGNIIGGGSGYAAGPLSLGAREFVSAQGTFSAIPIANAVSAVVSVVPTYPAPATAP